MPTLVKTTGPEAYPSAATEFLWTASTPAGDDVVLTGNDILLIWNSHGANPYTVTVTSQPDIYNRTGHITAYSLAAGEFAVFGPIPLHGWADGNRKLNLASENAAIKYAVITLHK